MGLDNPLHILLLLVVVLLVFGAKRLPEIGRSLGEGMRGFKDSLGGEGHNHNQSLAQAQPAAPAPAPTVNAAEPAAAPAPPTHDPGAPSPSGLS